jgi:hypothetical protein
MLVEHVEQSVGETPQEEQRSRQGERPQVWSSDETVSERVAMGNGADLVAVDESSSSSHVESTSVGVEGKGTRE